MIFDRDIVPALNGRWQEGNATSLPCSAVMESNEPLVIQEQRWMQLKVGSEDYGELVRKSFKDID